MELELVDDPLLARFRSDQREQEELANDSDASYISDEFDEDESEEEGEEVEDLENPASDDAFDDEVELFEARRACFRKVNFCVSVTECTFTWPMILALFICILVDPQPKSDMCSRYTQWAKGQLFLLVCYAISAFLGLLFSKPSIYEYPPPTRMCIAGYRMLQISRRVLLLCFISFLLLGWLFVFHPDSHHCHSKIPNVMNVVLAVLIIESFVTVVLILGCSILLCGWIFTLILYIREARARLPTGASAKEIESLRSAKYTPNLLKDHPLGSSSCAICIEDYEEGDEIRFLPCKHHYHLVCIDQWLHLNKTCPMCKASISPDDTSPPSSTTTTSPSTSPTSTSTSSSSPNPPASSSTSSNSGDEEESVCLSPEDLEGQPTENEDWI